MAAYFMVRAQVPDPADRKGFDRWYHDEHLPQALAAFKAKRAWRAWSADDASVHYAFYEFEDLARARGILGSAALKDLVAEFDRAWGDKMKRARDFLEVAQDASA
jgi:hypothetical protein